VGVSVGESEFVWGMRKARAAVRSRAREPPTQAATRDPNTLPLTSTLAGRRWPRRPLAHVRQSSEHGAQAVDQHQQAQDLRADIVPHVRRVRGDVEMC
jgi:hypothetical protein